MSSGFEKSTEKIRSRGMKLHGFFYFISCFLAITVQVTQGDGSADWRSGPPDSLPELTKLSVECGKKEMTIYLQFSAPYDGSVYSKTNGQSSRCMHVAPHSRITEATFTIEYDDCGTRSDPHGKFYENTIVIQYDDVVIEAWDEAKKIRCEWHDGYEKSAFKMPITISDLDVVEMNFQGDDVDCWLEVQDGKGPWSAKVEGLVPLGSPLTLVVAIQDSEGHFDMRVKSCIAHDGQKHPIHLTDEDGCVLRPKMMTPFQKTKETKGTASVIAYSHFYAFKFPETVEVTIQCTVEICRHGCPGTCVEGRDSQPPENDGVFQLPPSKDSEDVPTYKDSFPFSSVITSKPDIHNQSSSLNTSSSTIIGNKENVTKEENSDPLETSPNTNYDFYVNRYPYDLFDDLFVEDRQDDKHEYDRPSDKKYADDNDDVYYSQLPNIFGSVGEHGKNFPAAQYIQNLQNETKTEKDYSGVIANSSDFPMSEESHLSTVPSLFDETTLAIKTGMHTSTTEANMELNTTQSPNTSNTLKEVNDDEITDTSEQKDPNRESLPKQEALQSHNIVNDSTEFENADRSGDIFLGSNDYNDANVENRQTDYEFNSNRKLSEEDIIPKKDTEIHFEDYKVKARKPMDNYEARQNYHYRHHKSFLPPAPAPPITLYNGVPLYYYTQSNPNIDHLEEESHPYLSRYPYQKSYVKSKLRRPGRRRGRRDIGEKEQLGLKQTLRVIAIEDLDFFTKDNEKIKPLYVGKPDANSDVCMAPSSLAAGLGLLLLANICVFCIVVFLGHHYYIHKKAKVKTVELLDTELS